MSRINKIVYEEMYKIALYIEPYAKIFSIYKAIERFSTIPWQLIDLYPKDKDIIDKLHKIIGYYSLLCNIYHLLYFKKEPRVSLEKINGPLYKFPLYYRQMEIEGKPLHKYLIEKIFNNKYEAESRKKFRRDAYYDEIVSYKISIDNREEAFNKIEKSLLIDYERLFSISINPFSSDLFPITLYAKEEKSDLRDFLRDFFDKNLLWNSVLKDSVKNIFSPNLFISYGILSEMKHKGMRKEEQKPIRKYFEGIAIINIEIKEEEIEIIMGNLHNEIKGKIKEKKNEKEVLTNTAINLGINQIEEPCLMIEPICQLKITESLNIPIFLIYIAVMPRRVKLTKTIREMRDGINVENQNYLQRFCTKEKLI
jgi:hypothetical protein